MKCIFGKIWPTNGLPQKYLFPVRLNSANRNNYPKSDGFKNHYPVESNYTLNCSELHLYTDCLFICTKSINKKSSGGSRTIKINFNII